MSRVQSPDLSVVPLQPTAAPTNQFYAPEVRQGRGPSDDLIGLATGLSALEPKLQSVATSQLQAWAQGSEKRGAADQARLAIENKQGLLDAVKNGQIHESINPWYFRGLSQAVAGVEGDRAERELFDSYN